MKRRSNPNQAQAGHTLEMCIRGRHWQIPLQGQRGNPQVIRWDRLADFLQLSRQPGINLARLLVWLQKTAPRQPRIEPIRLLTWAGTAQKSNAQLRQRNQRDDTARVKRLRVTIAPQPGDDRAGVRDALKIADVHGMRSQTSLMSRSNLSHSAAVTGLSLRRERAPGAVLSTNKPGVLDGTTRNHLSNGLGKVAFIVPQSTRRTPKGQTV